MPDSMDAEMQELRGRLADAYIPPGEVAAELLDFYCDPHGLSIVPEEVEPLLFGRDLARDHGLLRAGAVAAALLARAPEHPTALTFAAGVAEWAGEGRRAVELLAVAAWNTYDLGVHREHALALLATGDLRMLLPLTEAADEDELFCREEIRRAAIRLAEARRRYPPERPCPCASGLAHAECCRPVEDAALEREGVC